MGAPCGYRAFQHLTINDEPLADYYINTKTKWRTRVLKGGPTFNHTYKFISALATSVKVQYLAIDLSSKLSPSQPTELLDLLCENLLRNVSLSHLYIDSVYFDDVPSEFLDALTRVIHTLIVRDVPLEGFGIRFTGELSLNASTQLMDQINALLVAYPTIKKLTIGFPLNTDQLRTLLSVLQSHCKELNVLVIVYNDSPVPYDLVVQWICYIAKAPIRKVWVPLGSTYFHCNLLKNLILPADLATQQDLLEEMLDENTTLEVFSGLTLRCTKRNKKKRMLTQKNNYQEFNTINIVPDISHNWHQGDEGLNYLTTLPMEIIQSILNMTNMPSIHTLRTTSSYFCSFIKRSSFWRSFYCSQARCVPSEVLEISDMMYGIDLYDNFKAHKASMTFWECITQAWYMTSGLLVCKNNNLAYLKSHRDFIDELYKAYPELATLCKHFQSGGPNYCVGTQKVNKWIKEPYTIIDFALHVDDYVTYHMIFELVGENSISVILIWKTDDEPNFSMKYIAHVFDWFHATSVEEAISKARSMAKDLIVANTAQIHSLTFTDNYQFYQQFRKFPFKRTISIQLQCLMEVQAVIDHKSTELIQALNITQDELFITLVQRFSNRLLQLTDISVPDYQQLRSVIDRAASNEKYIINNCYWNFEQNMNSPRSPNPCPGVRRPSKRQRKQLPKVLIQQFARRLLNLILMPVLKSLWYQDIYDRNFSQHTFCVGVSLDEGYFPQRWHHYNYYYSPKAHPFQTYLADIWVHPDYVTIQHAAPRAWPIAAASIARLIIPSLCNAVASLLHYQWDKMRNGTTSCNLEELNALFELLRQFDVIPLEHIKCVQQLLATEVDLS